MSDKIKVWRIKDTKTGLYYTGGTHGMMENPDYEKNDKVREAAYRAAQNWTWQQKRELDMWQGRHPWNRYYKDRWNSIGKIFTNKMGAEKALSTLTGTSKHTRKTPAKNILFGNEKSINYIVIETKLVDVKPRKNTKKDEIKTENILENKGS